MRGSSAPGLAGRLEAWSKEQTWLAIVLAGLALAMLDHVCPAIGMGPAYIPLICAAAWALGARASYAVAGVAAALSIMPFITGSAETGLAMLVLKVAIRLACYAFVAAIVTSFRRSYDRERFMARRDPMTGTANKATFERHVEKLLDAATSVDATLLLATIDLDNFKTVNDTYGHAAGDAALRAFAANAEALIRRQDCLGRIGGDEFAFLVSVQSIADGKVTAAALHTRLSALLRELPHPVTISMGAIVVGPMARLDRPALMQEADRLMYVVKRAGKCAVMIDSIGEPAQPVDPPSLPAKVRAVA